MIWFYENDSVLNAPFLPFTKTADTFNKNKRFHMTLLRLSSVCVKLEPASSKNNEILEINALQNFTSHALQGLMIMKKVIFGIFTGIIGILSL